MHLTLKVLQEFLHVLPAAWEKDNKDMMMFLLHIVDFALVGNLILMIIFAGYEKQIRPVPDVIVYIYGLDFRL